MDFAPYPAMLTVAPYATRSSKVWFAMSRRRSRCLGKRIVARLLVLTAHEWLLDDVPPEDIQRAQYQRIPKTPKNTALCADGHCQRHDGPKQLKPEGFGRNYARAKRTSRIKFSINNISPPWLRLVCSHRLHAANFSMA